VATWRTNDDRGVPARLALMVWPRRSDGAALPVLPAMRRAVSLGVRSRLVIVPLLVMTVIALVVVAVVKGGPWVLALLSFSPILSISLLFVFAAIVALSDGLERMKERLKTQRLRDGVCPACGYDVGSLTADAASLTAHAASLGAGVGEPAGWIVCPECGGSWSAARLGEPTRVVVRHGSPHETNHR